VYEMDSDCEIGVSRIGGYEEVMTYILVDRHRRFGSTYCLRLQTIKRCSYTLNIEASYPKVVVPITKRHTSQETYGSSWHGILWKKFCADKSMEPL
jgi:hypothetical protein